MVVVVGLGSLWWLLFDSSLVVLERMVVENDPLILDRVAKFPCIWTVSKTKTLGLPNWQPQKLVEPMIIV